MSRTLLILSLLSALIVPAACSAGKDGAVSSESESVSTAVAIGSASAAVASGRQEAIPKAIIYKTSADVQFNVPVTLNAAGTGLVSYPAPTDITPESAPIPLADGYLLDRRGVNAHSAFMAYTYGGYARLKQVPTVAELMKAIIPGVKVTALVRLPFVTSVAEADTAEVNRLIRSGLPGCEILLDAPTPPQAPTL